MSAESPTGTPPARPTLPDRQNAMLREMGVNVWWDAQAQVPPPPSPAIATDTRAAQATPARTGFASQVTPAVTSMVLPRPQQDRAPSPAKGLLAPIAAPVPAGDARALDEQIRQCQACGLSRGRQQAVPGMGDLSPDWLIVGEAPGEEEDRQGLPFVGRAGQLLDRMLQAMGLQREHKVYITNVVKCRPPHNRNPDPQELAQCTPYLLRQLDLLRPRIVLAMGRFAAQTVLAQGAFEPDVLRQMPLGKLRGRVHQIHSAHRSVPVVVTYHPAYLLRTPADKGKAWADLCLAMQTLENSGSPADPSGQNRDSP